MLAQWEYDLIHNVLGKPDEYRPGKQCQWCDLFANCMARTAVVKSSVSDIMGDVSKPGDPGWLERGKTILAALTPENKHEKEVAEVT